MNSVLQQIFMIDPIRTYILAVDGAADDFEEDEADKSENEVSLLLVSYFNLYHSIMNAVV